MGLCLPANSSDPKGLAADLCPYGGLTVTVTLEMREIYDVTKLTSRNLYGGLFKSHDVSFVMSLISRPSSALHRVTDLRLPKVLNKISQEPVEIILVTSWWPKRSWATNLVDLSLKHPIFLPSRGTFLRQPGSVIFHQNPDILKLQASRLETVAQGVQSDGFSTRVAEHIAKGSLEDSSVRVYNGRWSIFTN